MNSVDIVCLANSRKHGGRCVAGITEQGAWVRPVSDLDDGTLHASHYQLSNVGRPARPLDLIRVPTLKPRPAPHQPENIVSGEDWGLVRELGPREARVRLEEAVENHSELLERGTSDRISWTEILERPMEHSLAVVRPGSIAFNRTTSFGGGPQVRCRFEIDDDPPVSLVVTDAEIEHKVAQLAVGVYDRDDLGFDDAALIYLTLSLGEPFLGHCFKLVAAVIAA